MERGKLIVIEGTDCSGKETQSNRLHDYLNKMGIKTAKMQFPMYDSPTGKIVGGPYLGKSHICDSYFPEGAAHVQPKVAALYYTADRVYNIHKVTEKLDKGYNVILDRYVESNMAHHAGKLKGEIEQNEMINWLDKLEYGFLGLPRPDKTIFLHMPYEAAKKLKEGREEKPDGHEKSPEHLISAEKTYLKLAKKYFYDTVECVDGDRIKSIDEISDEVINIVLNTYYLSCQIGLD